VATATATTSLCAASQRPQSSLHINALASLGTARHGTAQHSTAQHSTAQHSAAQHSTAQHSMLH